MKIQVIEANSKRPLANTKIQLQVKGKDSGFLSLTTDGSGFLNLEDKLIGQQISAVSGTNTQGGAPNNQQGQWTTATEGARLTITTSKQHSTETTGGTRNK